MSQSYDFCGICQWLFFAGGLIKLNPQRAERVADFWYTWVLASFAIQVLAECDKIDVFCPVGNFTPIFKTIFWLFHTLSPPDLRSLHVLFYCRALFISLILYKLSSETATNNWNLPLPRDNRCVNCCPVTSPFRPLSIWRMKYIGCHFQNKQWLVL